MIDITLPRAEFDENGLKELVKRAAIHSVTDAGIVSTLQFMVPTGAFDILPVRLSEKTPTSESPSAESVERVAAQINRGFVQHIKYILTEASEVDVPVYGLDLDTGESQKIETRTSALDRNRLVFPHLRLDPFFGTPFLLLADEEL